MRRLSIQNASVRKWLCIGLTAGLLVSLVPLVAIAPYTHPCADDYSFGSRVVDTWRESGSLIETVGAAAAAAKDVYQIWQGTFMAVFFMSLQPAVFGEPLYAAVPFILAGLLLLAVYLLFRAFFVGRCGADKACFGIVAVIFAALSIHFLPSPAEGLYWYNGGMHYTGFYSMSLTVFALILTAERKKEKSIAAKACAAAAAVLSFMVGGGNYVTALTAAVVLALFTLHRALAARRRWMVPALCLLSLCAALLISVAAPGNAVRQEYFQSVGPVRAVLSSFGYALQFAAAYVPLPVWFAFGCMAPVLYGIARESSFTFRLPGAATPLFFGVYASTFTPNLYATGAFGPGRMLNINFFAFLLFLLATLFYWCGWAARGKALTAPEGTKPRRSPRCMGTATRVFIAFAICFAASCVWAVKQDLNATTATSAAYSLASGEAKVYNEEYQQRLSLLRDASVRDVTMRAYTYRPYVLFVDDLGYSADDWRNITVARYYGKASVVLTD